VEDFRAAKGMTSRPVKAFLPGPYSLYRFSKDLHYADPVRACAAVGEALAKEAAALEAAGASWIHLEEPWLGRARAEDAEAVRAALTPVLAGRTLRTVLHVPFRAPNAIFASIRDLPWNTLGLDLVEAPAGWDLIPMLPEGRGVALGLIDARNTKLEESAEVARQATRAAGLRPDLHYQITPTASLEYLPADKAEAKVARLVESARLAGKGAA
jgi:5-methyltetrahydropteroyltriglutamate--homocysteine methyltransferase